jgi:hypothetical protein
MSSGSTRSSDGRLRDYAPLRQGVADGLVTAEAGRIVPSRPDGGQ